MTYKVSPRPIRIEFLGCDGADRCVQSDCSVTDCSDPAHQQRETLVRVTIYGDSDTLVLDGTLALWRDPINGGWMVAGDSINCWIGPEALLRAAYEHADLRKALYDNATDWRVRTVNV